MSDKMNEEEQPSLHMYRNVSKRHMALSRRGNQEAMLLNTSALSPNPQQTVKINSSGSRLFNKLGGSHPAPNNVWHILRKSSFKFKAQQAT